MDSLNLTSFIKDEALKLGFDACGIAHVSPVDEEHRNFFKSWLINGYDAEMSYMQKNQEKRFDPGLLAEGAKSVIVVALNYYHEAKYINEYTRIAKYAINPDYHYIIRDRLRELLLRINELGIEVNGRAFADSAPVAERYWAAKAGIGWIGKNQNLIIEGKGSFFFLGELIVDIELEYDKPVIGHCGSCRKCMEVCPGSALSAKDGLDSNRCISYLTIEKKGSFSQEEEKLCGKNKYFFGCDICQDVCPWNRFSKEQTLSFMQPVDDIISMETESLDKMSEEIFKNKFEGTCLYRSGLEAIKRNIDSIKKSSPL